MNGFGTVELYFAGRSRQAKVALLVLAAHGDWAVTQAFHDPLEYGVTHAPTGVSFGKYFDHPADAEALARCLHAAPEEQQRAFATLGHVQLICDREGLGVPETLRKRATAARDEILAALRVALKEDVL